MEDLLDLVGRDTSVKMRLQRIEVVGCERKVVCGEDNARQGVIHVVDLYSGGVSITVQRQQLK
jgi:hypothetical protein